MKKLQWIFVLSVFIFILPQARAQDTATTAAASYFMSPNEVTILPSTRIDINVVRLIGEDFDFSRKPLLLVSWTINGYEIKDQNPADGHLDFSFSSTATYTAPATPPPRDPIVITASFSSTDPSDLAAGKTKILLICRIHIYDAPNFFYIASGARLSSIGTLYKFKEPVLELSRQSAERVMEANGEWNVHNSGINEQGDQLNIRLTFNGASPGTYSWRMQTDDKGNIIPPVVAAAVDVIGGANGHASYFSLKLPGTIVIKTFDPKTKIVRGYFYGPMMNAEKQTVFVSGGFTSYIF